MYKHLFFDDKYLLVKENVKRSYGTPSLCEDAIYCDENVNSSYASPWVFKLDNGKYRMLYYGPLLNVGSASGVFAAISEDGIHFEPEDVTAVRTATNVHTKNQVFVTSGYVGEAACFFEDKHTDKKDERYKMLVAHYYNDPPYVEGWLYTSPDLINWTRVEDVLWSKDGEPVVGVFYNDKKKCFTIIKRLVAGVRMIGYVETTDWRNFTEIQKCVQVDSLDGDLEELYGMPSFAYDGWFIGFPLIYGNLTSKLESKYAGGTMKAQLAYSQDGRYWVRSLREPFISGQAGDKTASDAFNAPMVWPMTVRVADDGNIYIHAGATELEHGFAFHGVTYPSGRMLTYKLRRDGFIKLESRDKDVESVVATRENIWHGGDLHLNLKSRRATVAVYEGLERNSKGGVNSSSLCAIMDGFSHEDCIAFEGDSTNWIPEFKSGKKISDLEGKTLIFELKFEDGEIYSIYGEMTPVFNVPAARYRINNEMPPMIL